MRVFKLTYDRRWQYDEFDEFAVLAESEEDAFAALLEHLAERHRKFWTSLRHPIPESEWSNDTDSLMWSQREHVIIEPVNERGVVVSSYRAG